jgi:hypothetical protein
MPPKFTFKECCCAQWDAICSCYEAKQYEYLKTHLHAISLPSSTSCGDDIKVFIKQLLAEVEKPYEDAKLPE